MERFKSSAKTFEMYFSVTFDWNIFALFFRQVLDLQRFSIEKYNYNEVNKDNLQSQDFKLLS